MKNYSKFVIETVKEMKEKQIFDDYSYIEVRKIVEGIAEDEETVKAFLETNFDENLEGNQSWYKTSEVRVRINDFEEIAFEAKGNLDKDKTTYEVNLYTEFKERNTFFKYFTLAEVEVTVKSTRKRIQRYAKMKALSEYLLGNLN